MTSVASTASAASLPVVPASTSPAVYVSTKTWVAVVGAALGAFLAILNIQVVSSSLADIQGAIGTGADEGGWIVTSYLVAEIIIIPMSGWFARIFSLRTYLLASTFLFLVLTVACGFAENLGEMIVLRALQGLAGGALIPLAFSIIMTRLPPSKHPIGLTIYSVSAIFAPSIGPVIGGYFNDTFGWQSIFYVSVLPGAVMFAMLWLSLDPEPRQLGQLLRGDWLGIITIAVGLGALETLLEEGNKNDWLESTYIIRLAVVAGVALALFLVVEFVRKAPLLHLRLFARRNFGLGSIANFFFGLSMYGWLYIVPVYLARIQGYNAEQIGKVLIWIGLPQLLILPVIPKVIKIVPPKYLVVAGYILFIVGSLMATHLSDDFFGATIYFLESCPRPGSVDGDDAAFCHCGCRHRARICRVGRGAFQHGPKPRGCDRNCRAANISHKARTVSFRYPHIAGVALGRDSPCASGPSRTLFHVASGRRTGARSA
jgi:MFS transporter, DHA2 family, multidrug resistance protein